jgi:chromosome segregation ATPase
MVRTGKMARPASLETALKRLTSAVDQLEAASGRLAQTGAEKADLEQALALMQEDRGRLAQDLDAALFRARSLELANEQVAKRLNEAGDVLRHLLVGAGSKRD